MWFEYKNFLSNKNYFNFIIISLFCYEKYIIVQKQLLHDIHVSSIIKITLHVTLNMHIKVTHEDSF